MKRMLKKDDFSITVQVIVDCYIEEWLTAASKVRPIQPDYPVDRSIDEQALADYHAFIEESLSRIEDLDLEIIEHNSSSKSETSEYYTLMDITQDVEHTAKYMIFLRISDHSMDILDPERKIEIQRDIREHRRYFANKYGNLQGHRVTWKVREVIVNNDRFHTYDEAVEHVVKLADEWSQLLKNNPYEGE